MRDALVVLNPRNISVCLAALSELDIPKIFLRGWTERDIEREAFQQVLGMGHSWLWVVSDDAIVRPHALEAVRLLAHDGHPVVTGYSQRSHSDFTVNLTRRRLGELPVASSYDFYGFHEVVSSLEPVVPTFFAGMSLTGMSVDLWTLFPFGCYGDEADPGYASDFHLSRRLQDAEIPIVAARDGFCYHWRHNWINTTDPRDATPNTGEKTIVTVSA